MFQIRAVEKIKTHFMSRIFFSENCVVYEIIRKNMVQPDRPLKTIQRMRVACWITKATFIQSIQYFLISQGNDGYGNAPQCHVTRPVPVLY